MRRTTLIASTALLLAATASAWGQTRLDAKYSVYLTGIPIGQGAVILDVTETGFAAAGSAKFTGLLRMVAKGEGTSTVRGTFANNRPWNTIYNMQSNSTERSEKVDITVQAGTVKTFSLVPPRKGEEEINRVPVLEAHLKNALDPMSAGLLLVAGEGELISPEACNRTLPIFDARIRYDVVLSFKSIEKLTKKIDGYNGPVVVCQARYVPVSGHRANHNSVKAMADNREIFIWLAPIEGTRALVPIKVSIGTTLGTLVVEATQFRATPNRQALSPR
ncbi:MAG: DUF3108 domain-containing protein [Xanthobacteraceae bacterium]|nr:DUF3108 domain-containing protein [Xanthobacteraceae bacterium]QYK44740.1 MAG: DUF3108 domain-containing protein [Xanthobacteraceae bacterium]